MCGDHIFQVIKTQKHCRNKHFLISMNTHHWKYIVCISQNLLNLLNFNALKKYPSSDMYKTPCLRELWFGFNVSLWTHGKSWIIKRLHIIKSCFFPFSFLNFVYSQIWLNPLMVNFGQLANLKKIQTAGKKKKKKVVSWVSLLPNFNKLN